MNVLGLSASPRPWGNSDLLVRHALRGARDEGAETRFVRLAELRLGPCSGCLSCVLRRRDCRLRDDLGLLLAALREADAVVLGSPAYVLGATGIVKTLQERLLRCAQTREFGGKPALVMAAAGVPGWETFALPQLSQLFLFLGMPIVDQFVGYAQGPGEILFAPAALERARSAGAALGRGEKEFRGEPGTCPVCRFDLVTVGAEGLPACALCNLPGSWVPRGNGLAFEPLAGAEPRWAGPALRRHFEEKILPSRSRFKARLADIRERLRAFQEGEGS